VKLMDRTDAVPADVSEHRASGARAPTKPAVGSVARETVRTCGPAERSLEEESNPWKETKCMQPATVVCTTDSSVEEYLRPAGGCVLWALETRRDSEPWQRGDGARSDATCGGRGKKVRTLAGAFEPTFTMTETRAARSSGVACPSRFTPEGGSEVPAHRDGGR
jgi:hypothetical protein